MELNIQKFTHTDGGSLVLNEWAIPHVDENGNECGAEYYLALTYGKEISSGADCSFRLAIERVGKTGAARWFVPYFDDLDDWEHLIELAADFNCEKARDGFNRVCAALDWALENTARGDFAARGDLNALREQALAAFKSLENRI